MHPARFYIKRTRSELVYDISQLLKSGKLSLIVGAGISRDLGVPLWRELAKHCLLASGFDKEANLIDKTTPTQQLLDLMGMVVRGRNYAEYIELVHKGLYPSGMPNSLNATPLLRALGALCMGSARGRITDIINYNFDCMLEQYFRCHGYVIQVLTEAPTLTASADVRIWHPHGYLPFDGFGGSMGKISSKLMFDCDSADDFIGKRDEPWMDVLRFMYGSKVFLAIGLSGEDPLTNIILRAASTGVENNRPIGFWLYKKGDIADEILEKLKTRGIVPVEFDDFIEYPTYLMGICEHAAGPVL